MQNGCIAWRGKKRHSIKLLQKCRKWKKWMMPTTDAWPTQNKWKNKQNATVVNWFWCDVKWCIFHFCSSCDMWNVTYDLILQSCQFEHQINQKETSFSSIFQWIFKWRNNNIMICTIDFIFCIVHVPFVVCDRVLHASSGNQSSAKIPETMKHTPFYTNESASSWIFRFLCIAFWYNVKEKFHARIGI